MNDILNDNLKENVVPENVFKELNTVYMQLTGQELQKEGKSRKRLFFFGKKIPLITIRSVFSL